MKSSSAMKRLRKKAKKGSLASGLVATIAFYGPDDKRASKVAVGIVPYRKGSEAIEIRRWFSDTSDLRHDEAIGLEILDFLKSHGVQRVAMTDRIIGCPHEEGIDYEGPVCPKCPFWANRDRWTGKRLSPDEIEDKR